MCLACYQREYEDPRLVTEVYHEDPAHESSLPVECLVDWLIQWQMLLPQPLRGVWRWMQPGEPGSPPIAPVHAPHSTFQIEELYPDEGGEEEGC